MSDLVSVFRPVAIGNVDTNRTPGTTQKIINVTPSELMVMHDGEMTSNAQTLEFTVTDIDGVSRSGAAVVDQVFPAEWIPWGSNRATPPDVRRGERVLLWQTGDADKFYWTSLGLDDDLRRLETIILRLSNTRDESVKQLTPQNTYWIEWSTHSKRLAIKTTKNDGEPFEYDILLDTKIGEFSLGDDIGNLIELLSKKKVIRLLNADKTLFELNQKNINFYAPQNVVGKAGRDINIQAGGDIDVKAGGTITLNGGGSTIVISSGSIVETAPSIQMNNG